jgi:hypothetical protein
MHDVQTAMWKFLECFFFNKCMHSVCAVPEFLDSHVLICNQVYNSYVSAGTGTYICKFIVVFILSYACFNVKSFLTEAMHVSFGSPVE